VAVDGLACAQTEIERIGDIDWANLGAFSTPGAVVFVNVARFTMYPYIEVAYVS
jgi:hypothetical protein